MRMTRTPSSPSSLRTALASSSGSSDARASAELQRVERRRVSCVRPPAPCGCKPSTLVEQRLGVVLGPVGRRDAQQGLDGGVAVGVVLDELGQRLERLPLPGRGRVVRRAWRPGGRRARAIRVPTVERRLDVRRRVASSSRRRRSRSVSSTLSVKSCEPVAQVAVGAVVDDDRFDRDTRAPRSTSHQGFGVFSSRVRLAAVAVGAALVAVDGLRSASPPCAVLFCVALPCAGDVLAVADRPRLRPASASAACRAARCGRSGPGGRLSFGRWAEFLRQAVQAAARPSG